MMDFSSARFDSLCFGSIWFDAGNYKCPSFYNNGRLVDTIASYFILFQQSYLELTFVTSMRLSLVLPRSVQMSESVHTD
jgi:hypothetical protein